MLQRLEVRRCLGTLQYPLQKTTCRRDFPVKRSWGHVLHASGRRRRWGFRKGWRGVDDIFFLELSKYQMGKGKQKHHLHLQVIVLLIYMYIYRYIYHPICFLPNKLGKPCFLLVNNHQLEILSAPQTTELLIFVAASFGAWVWFLEIGRMELFFSAEKFWGQLMVIWWFGILPWT